MSDIIYDWYGMLLTLLLIVTLMLAIYACCNHCAADNTVGLSSFRHRPASVAPHTSHSSNSSVRPAGSSPGAEEQYQLEGTSTGSRAQNLVSPFTFLPPAYDTLPKGPPKYEDIYLVNEHTTDIDSAVQRDPSLTTNVETTRDVHRPMADVVETRDNYQPINGIVANSQSSWSTSAPNNSSIGCHSNENTTLSSPS